VHGVLSKGPDHVVVTTQTFLEYVMPDLRRRVAEALALPEDRVSVEKIYSNMQPVLHEVFERVIRTRERILVVGIEGLSLLDRGNRPHIIGKALKTSELRKQYGTMANAVGKLFDSWVKHLPIDPALLRPILEKAALQGYEHAYQNPDAQFFDQSLSKRITTEKYRQVTRTVDESGWLTTYDCCPGNTSQSAAMLVGPKGNTEVLGWVTCDDPRPFDERLRFEDYPAKEATTLAWKRLSAKTGVDLTHLKREAILQIHDAFGPFLFMTLLEMGYGDPLLNTAPFFGLNPKNINPCGGLKAGHPLGATALVKFHESVGALEQRSCKKALIHSIWGARDRISMTLIERH
jgi:acetyl-CoA acetyltransferase